MSKKKSSLLNIITMGIYQFTTAIIGFIIPKLLLDTFGADIHGYTSTVTTIMGYVSLLNAGLSTAGIQALYKPLVQKDKHRISEIINAVNKFYIKTGIMYTIAIICCSVILPYVIKGEISNYNIILLMIVMGGTSTIECFIYSKYRVLLQADQHLYIVNISNTIAILIRVALQIIFIKSGFGIVMVQTIPLLMVFVRMLMLHVYVKKNYGYIDKKVKPDDKALSKRWSVFTHQISGLVVNNTDVVLLSMFKNLTIVSIYSVYNLVFSNLYTILTTIFSNGTVASFGAAMNEGNHKKILDAYNIYEFTYYFIVSAVFSITACLILPFVSIYTMDVKDIAYVDIKLAVLFTIISILNNLRVPCNTIINAAGHFKETKWRALTEASINLVVSLLLLKPLGLYGLLVGTICSFIYRTFDIIIYSNKKILNRKVYETIKRIARVLVVITINVVLYKMFLQINVTNWGSWVLQAIIVGIVSLITSVTCSLAFERNTIELIIKNFVKK